MRSTIVIANDLDKLRSLLTQKPEELVEDAILNKQLRDISGYIGIIGIFNGLETSKKMIVENLTNTKTLISNLNENPTIKSIAEINKLLNMINTFVIEKAATIFSSTKENTLQSQPNAEINDKKEISPTSAKHINGVTSQTVVSGSPTKKQVKICYSTQKI